MRFEFIPDEPKSEQEASHCVFRVVDFLVLGGYSAQSPCKFDKLVDQRSISRAFIVGALDFKPWESIAGTADNFRKALEEFFQEFLGNTKNLDNNISEVFKYLGANNAEPEVASLMKSLISTYNTLNNKVLSSDGVWPLWSQ